MFTVMFDSLVTKYENRKCTKSFYNYDLVHLVDKACVFPNKKVFNFEVCKRVNIEDMQCNSILRDIRLRSNSYFEIKKEKHSKNRILIN